MTGGRGPDGCQVHHGDVAGITGREAVSCRRCDRRAEAASVDQSERDTVGVRRFERVAVDRPEVVGDQVDGGVRRRMETHRAVRADRGEGHVRIDRARSVVGVGGVGRRFGVAARQDAVPRTVRPDRGQVHDRRIARFAGNGEAHRSTRRDPLAGATSVESSLREPVTARRRVRPAVDRRQLIGDHVHRRVLAVPVADPTVTTDRRDRHVRVGGGRPVVHVRRRGSRLARTRREHAVAVTAGRHRCQVHQRCRPGAARHGETGVGTRVDAGRAERRQACQHDSDQVGHRPRSRAGEVQPVCGDPATPSCAVRRPVGDRQLRVLRRLLPQHRVVRTVDPGVPAGHPIREPHHVRYTLSPSLRDDGVDRARDRAVVVAGCHHDRPVGHAAPSSDHVERRHRSVSPVAATGRHETPADLGVEHMVRERGATGRTHPGHHRVADEQVGRGDRADIAGARGQRSGQADDRHHDDQQSSKPVRHVGEP